MSEVAEAHAELTSMARTGPGSGSPHRGGLRLCGQTEKVSED